MGTRIGIGEFLEKVSRLKYAKEKVAALRENDSIQLRIVLQGAFDPTVKWLLPTGTPPFTPCAALDQQGTLIREAVKLRYFIDGFYPNLKQMKREMMWIQLLETVDSKDAALLCAIKEKRLPWAGITYQHVREALPGLLPEEAVGKKLAAKIEEDVQTTED